MLPVLADVRQSVRGPVRISGGADVAYRAVV